MNSILTSEGQLTVPKEIRDRAGFESGDRVKFRVRKDGVVELERDNAVDVMSLFGILKPAVKGVTIEDMNETIRLKGAGLIE